MFQWPDLCHVPYFLFFVWNLKKSFVFIYLAVLGLSFGLQDLCCIMSSGRSFRRGAQTRQLRCAGAAAPRRTGSLLCQGLGCPPSEYGIFVPRPGIKPTSPALQGEILTTGPRRKFLISFIFNFNQFVCSRAIWQRLSFLLWQADAYFNKIYISSSSAKVNLMEPVPDSKQMPLSFPLYGTGQLFYGKCYVCLITARTENRAKMGSVLCFRNCTCSQRYITLFQPATGHEIKEAKKGEKKKNVNTRKLERWQGRTQTA